MNNGTIINDPKEKQYKRLLEVLEDAQTVLKEVKYKGNYPTLYDFINWSLKNSSNIISDIEKINTIDNKVILSRKLFEIYLSMKVTRNNAKLNLDKSKLVPKFIQSSTRKLEIKRLCTEVNLEKDFYTFYSTFSHPYNYSKIKKNEENRLDIETSPMLYYISDYEYQVNLLNQNLLIYMVKDMIDDMNYIIQKLLSSRNDCVLDCYVLNKEMIYAESISILNKINKKINRNNK